MEILPNQTIVIPVCKDKGQPFLFESAYYNSVEQLAADVAQFNDYLQGCIIIGIDRVARDGTNELFKAWADKNLSEYISLEYGKSGFMPRDSSDFISYPLPDFCAGHEKEIDVWCAEEIEILRDYRAMQKEDSIYMGGR